MGNFASNNVAMKTPLAKKSAVKKSKGGAMKLVKKALSAKPKKKAKNC